MLNVQRSSGAVVKTSMKFWKRNGCGQSCDESACSFVISDVSVMKTNGSEERDRERDQHRVGRDQVEQAPAPRTPRRRGGRRAASAGAVVAAARHRGTAWCTQRREFRTITSVTANETASSSIASADA